MAHQNGNLKHSVFLRKQQFNGNASDTKKGNEGNSYLEINVYIMEYYTSYQNAETIASALIYVPLHIDASIVCYQHETMFLSTEAPSVQRKNDLAETFAGAGFITVVPDYTGYGISNQLFHPYYDKHHAACCVSDCITALLQFLSLNKVEFSKHLFLAGYSEGGYVTLAALHQLEGRKSIYLEVKASAACAGGYDLFHLLSAFAQPGVVAAKPAHILFLLLSYNHLYQWKKPLDHYFLSGHLTLIQELFSGNFSEDKINAQLPGSIMEILQPQFLQNLFGSGELELKKALLSNSLSNVRVDTPMRLYHGTADEIIPYENSVVTYKKLTDLGSRKLQLVPLEGHSHNSSSKEMAKEAVLWFKSLEG